MTNDKYFGRVKTYVSDSWNTPKNAWIDILHYIKKDSKIWLPFYNDGKALEILNNLEYNNVVHVDKDFYTYWIDNAYIIDNPPFSTKQKIIDKLFNKKVKFSLLLPLDTLERKYLKKYIKNLQIVIPSTRYNFRPDCKGQMPFKCCWFCWNMSEELKTKDHLIFL